MASCDRCHKKFGTYAALKQHYSNQHSNAKWPDAFENKLVEERGLQAYEALRHPTRSSHTKLILAAVLIVVVVGAIWIYLPTATQTPANPQCANFPFPPIGNQNLAEDYHAVLLINLYGEQVNLPVNIGEGDFGPCTQPLHVRASNPNVIYVESPEARSYSLGDFFKVWAATPDVGGPTPVVFTQDQIFSHVANVGNGVELRMYVNGQQSTAYGSLVLESHLVILIALGPPATDWSYYQKISSQQWPYPGL